MSFERCVVAKPQVKGLMQNFLGEILLSVLRNGPTRVATCCEQRNHDVINTQLELHCRIQGGQKLAGGCGLIEETRWASSVARQKESHRQSSWSFHCERILQEKSQNWTSALEHV